MPLEHQSLTEEIIGAGIEVHSNLGPGLLESVYEECLAIEFESRGLRFERQRELPIVYKNHVTPGAYRLDFVVEKTILLELKSCQALEPIHEAQTLTYLRLSKLPVALLINFNVPMLRQGIKRLVLTRNSSASSVPPR